MDISATIEAELALARQALALSMVKHNAEMQQQVAAILEQAILNVPASSTRGANVNISA